MFDIYLSKEKISLTWREDRFLEISVIFCSACLPGHQHRRQRQRQSNSNLEISITILYLRFKSRIIVWCVLDCVCNNQFVAMTYDHRITMISPRLDLCLSDCECDNAMFSVECRHHHSGTTTFTTITDLSIHWRDRRDRRDTTDT